MTRKSRIIALHLLRSGSCSGAAAALLLNFSVSQAVSLMKPSLKKLPEVIHPSRAQVAHREGKFRALMFV